MFFVLSGFLITGILLGQVGKAGWLRRFWIRRTFRILPLYCLFLVTVLSLHLMRGAGQGGFHDTPATIWPYFLMLQNIEMARSDSLGPWGVTWSLAIEEQFYMVFPAFVAISFIRRKLIYLCCLAVGCSLFLRLNGAYLYSFVLTHYRLDGLACGAICAVLAKKPKVMRVLGESRLILPLLLVTGASLLAVITLRSQTRHPVDHTVFGFAYGSLLLSLIVRKRGWIVALLSNGLLRYTGKISYALYLFHGIVAWGWHRHYGVGEGIGLVLTALVISVLSFLAAALLNSYVGEPCVSLGRRIAGAQR